MKGYANYERRAYVNLHDPDDWWGCTPDWMQIDSLIKRIYSKLDIIDRKRW